MEPHHFTVPPLGFIDQEQFAPVVEPLLRRGADATVHRSAHVNRRIQYIGQ